MTEKDYNNCVHQYADNIFRFLVKNLRQEDNARDIVQSSFEKLWINKSQVEPGKAKSYLFTVAYNLMIDHIRRSKKIDLQDEFGKDERIVYQKDLQLKKVLDLALQRLPDLQRSLILLKDYEGYSYEEIGKITSLNASQVKVYLHRARLAMRNYLVDIQYIL
ncbi:MAG: RNA polymerase sigma factor [Pseudopedobacter saltans]|uniref:RNA polymerase sigma factor n=1 Tax=Pseudopedobacter saltans TaxID=151895 RepID=A0A2W5H0S4_9SPHI|nr:MAG: RNA polymerase sigma factor [Pseudopedobacter saltans]